MELRYALNRLKRHLAAEPGAIDTDDVAPDAGPPVPGVLALGEGNWLVTDAALTRRLLQSPDFVPFPLADSLAAMGARVGLDTSPLERYLRQTPVLLEGAEHRAARLAVMTLYLGVEKRGAAFIRAHAREAVARRGQPRNAAAVLPMARDFVDGALLRLVADELARRDPAGDAHAAPPIPLPTNFLALSPGVAGLRGAVADMRAALARLALHGVHDAQAMQLLSLVVMGREPTTAAVTWFALHGAGMDAAEVFDRATPTNAVARLCPAGADLDGLRFPPGAVVYAGLRDANRSPDGHLAFGAGRHVCPGRRLAHALLDAFMQAWRDAGLQPPPHPETLQARRELFLEWSPAR